MSSSAISRLDPLTRPQRTNSAMVAPIVSLAGHIPPPVSAHLQQVDTALNTSLSQLHDLWFSDVHASTQAAVLGALDLPELLGSVLSSGGKRIRPIMAYLGWQAVGTGSTGSTGSSDDVVRISAALELLHAFALIHDDVMDQSATRRGQPTVHARMSALHLAAGGLGSSVRFGEDIAILLGDLAHAEADHLMAGLPVELRRPWHELVIELVCGQRADIVGSASTGGDLVEALHIARMKSGSYTIQRPLELGAIAANASDQALKRLSSYGLDLGTAFALRDDILGVWGDPSVTGKPAGDDLLSGKPTVIVALALERSTGAVRQLLNDLGTFALTPPQITMLQHEIKECGVLAQVELMINNHTTSALAALDTDELDAAAVQTLTQLAHQIAWRDQ